LKTVSLDNIDNSHLLMEEGRFEMMFGGWLNLQQLYLVELFGLVHGV